jgi:hypothetical protein
MSRRLRGVVAAQPAGYAQQASRLPEEARHLASLPVSAAIAARLDTRANRERTRATATASATAHASDEVSVAAATWSWPALAAVAIPAVILLAVALV